MSTIPGSTFDAIDEMSEGAPAPVDELPVDRERRVSGDEPLRAQLTPEVARDGGRQRGTVFRNAFGAAGPRDDGGRGGVRERELQSGGLDGNLMALGEGLDALDLGQDLWGRLLVLEVGAADQNPRAIWAADNDVHLLGCGGRHQALQRPLMIE